MVTWPTSLTADFGQALADVSLPSDPLSVFTWTIPTDSVGNAGVQMHNMTFTPSDTANFNTATNDVAVTVSMPQPVPVITIITQPADATVTAGSIDSSLSVTTAVTQGVTPSYRWHRATDADRTGVSTFIGVTTATFPKPTTLTGETYYFYVVVSAPGAASVMSDVATVTVNAARVFPFVDVPPTHWARGAVASLYFQDIVQGTSPTTFSPGNNFTHGMAVTILWRIAGEPVLLLACQESNCNKR